MRAAHDGGLSRDSFQRGSSARRPQLLTAHTQNELGLLLPVHNERHAHEEPLYTANCEAGAFCSRAPSPARHPVLLEGRCRSSMTRPRLTQAGQCGTLRQTTMKKPVNTMTHTMAALASVTGRAAAAFCWRPCESAMAPRHARILEHGV